jgi:hypothetical protein
MLHGKSHQFALPNRAFACIPVLIERNAMLLPARNLYYLLVIQTLDWDYKRHEQSDHL